MRWCFWCSHVLLLSTIIACAFRFLGASAYRICLMRKPPFPQPGTYSRGQYIRCCQRRRTRRVTSVPPRHVFVDERPKQYDRQFLCFCFERGRRRSDISCFFTDIQLSSVTSDISHRRNISFFTDIAKSVKAPSPTDDWVYVSFFGDAPTFKVFL